MSDYIVSARKYRPADFASVVGQGHITSTLKNAITRGQLAHAYLFCGPRGVGKTTCARIFAKAINCLTPVGDEACGECESCRAFAEGRSFSIHELDAASNNSVEDIRSLTEQVRIPPQVGRYSVYIIDEVHMLSTAAFNAFLKTLEEPPAHAIFILATTEKHKILPTILSRCQIFDFNRIRVEDGVGYLRYIADKEGVTADDESLHLIALKADGGMRDALSMFDKAVSFCGNTLTIKDVARTLNVLDYDTYFNVAAQLLAGDYQSVLTGFDAVIRSGFSPQSFAAGLNGHFRDLLMSKNPQTLPLLEVSGSLLERYKAQGGEFPLEFLFDSIGVLTMVDGTLKSATNQRLNVELSLMKIAGLGQKKNDESGRPELPALVVAGGSRGAAGNLTAAPAAAEELEVGVSTPPTVGKDGSNVCVGRASAESPSGDAATPGGEPRFVRDAHGGSSLAACTENKSATTSTQPNNVALNDDASTLTAKKTDNSTLTPRSSLLTPNSKSPILSGNSIGALMNAGRSVHAATNGADGANGSQGTTETGETDGDETPHPAPPCEDSEVETKIEHATEHFLRELHRRRPRIAMALEEMTVEGNAIKVSVPTTQLHDEIMRNRTEVLTLLADIAGVAGRLELIVTVEEDTRPGAPIKAEDKLRFLTERNPALTALRKELNLELE